MRSWHKLEEYHRIHGNIATRSSSNDSPENAEPDKVVDPSDSKAKDSTDQKGDVERRLPSNLLCC